jgi:hypothetical protein
MDCARRWSIYGNQWNANHAIASKLSEEPVFSLMISIAAFYKATIVDSGGISFLFISKPSSGDFSDKSNNTNGNAL